MNDQERKSPAWLETQRAVLDAEFYWTGGYQNLLGSTACRGVRYAPLLSEPSVLSQESSEGGRSIHYKSTNEGWELTFDEA